MTDKTKEAPARSALKLALEWDEKRKYIMPYMVRDAIREALASEASEESSRSEQTAIPTVITCPFCASEHVPGWLHDYNMDRGAYGEQSAQRTWVGLTEKEKRDARNSVSYSPLAMTMGEWTEAVQDATEAKLREKNNDQQVLTSYRL